MKKILCSMLCVVLMLSIALSTAMAASYSFTLKSAHDASNCTPQHTGYDWYSSTHSGMMYVYSNVKEGGSISNLFSVYYNGSTYGSKWCTPGLNVTIGTSIVTPGNYYGLWGRANTRYYDEASLSSITVYGTYGWKL